jgi:molybdopterin synthase sulfur carrier subunit
MRVTIRLFGRLHDLANAHEVQCEVPDGATVGVAWEHLVRAHPPMAGYARSISAAVNEEFSRMTTPLADGDEVAFLPPVSGG